MRTLYETIMDVSLNIRDFDKKIFNFGDYFIPKQYEIVGDMNMLDFNKIKSDITFKGYDGINIINKDHLNESKSDKPLAEWVQENNIDNASLLVPSGTSLDIKDCNSTEYFPFFKEEALLFITYQFIGTYLTLSSVIP